MPADRRTPMIEPALDELVPDVHPRTEGVCEICDRQGPGIAGAGGETLCYACAVSLMLHERDAAWLAIAAADPDCSAEERLSLNEAIRDLSEGLRIAESHVEGLRDALDGLQHFSDELLMRCDLEGPLEAVEEFEEAIDVAGAALSPPEEGER